MNHFTIMDLEELEYEAEKETKYTWRFEDYFEDMESEPQHLVFFDFSGCDLFQKVLQNSLRGNDIIRREKNCYCLRLEGMSNEARYAVLSRIRKNLEKEGLYSVLNMNVDAEILKESRDPFPYRIAV